MTRTAPHHSQTLATHRTAQPTSTRLRREGPQRTHAQRTHAPHLHLGLCLSLAAVLQGCGSMESITRSAAAPQVDAALGQSVRAARAAQTLNPTAGQDPLLPQEMAARAALARMGAAAGMAGRGHGTGSMHEPVAPGPGLGH